METTLMSLPSELIATILANLPLHTLLAFSATSRTNRVLAQTAMQELNLAVFPRVLYGRLALIRYNADSESYKFSVIKTTTLEKSSDTSNPIETLRRQVDAQNTVAAEVLKNKFTHHLRSLSLHMYDCNSYELASVIAHNLPKLRELTLNFCHPYVRDNSISSSYWKEAPAGSPCWNALVGLGIKNQKDLRLRDLLSLRIERAGLTSAQLRKFVESNPRLRGLSLENVTGVDQEFVRWLGAYCESGRSRLEGVTLQRCLQLKMQKVDDFAWLASITRSLRYLSLFKCSNVRHEMLISLIDDEDDELELKKLETIIPPKGPPRHFGIAEEIGSAYLPVAMAAGIGGIGKPFVAIDKIDVDPEFMLRAMRVGV